MLKVIVIAVLFGAALAATGGRQEAVASGKTSDDPIVVIWREGGLHRPVPPLEFALWADGTMLRSVRIVDSDSPLMVAKASPAAVDLLLTRLEEAQFFEHPSVQSWPPDASYTVILAANGQRANMHAWTEHLNVAHSGAPSAEWTRFLQMWLDTRAAILRMPPIYVDAVDNKLDDEGRFRGYDPKRPERTPWLKSRWKPKADETEVPSP